jgi:putative exporter of polyketide antibiotics
VTAAIITAIASLFTALGLLITAFTVLIPLLRKTKAIEERQEVVVAKTEHMTKLVNSNHMAMLRREEVLIAALQSAGIVIPPNEEIKKEPKPATIGP